MSGNADTRDKAGPVLGGAREVDRSLHGRIAAEDLVETKRRAFLPGTTSEAYFGKGVPVLGARISEVLSVPEISYRARRLLEVAQSRNVAIVVMTAGRLAPWERAGLRCEHVAYGTEYANELEEDIVQLWAIDLVMDYEDVLKID